MSETPKMTLVETIEDEVTKSNPDPIVLCGLIEQVTGGSSTSPSFRGRMLEIRAAGQVELVVELAKALEHQVEMMRVEVAKRKETGESTKDLESDIALYEESIEDARTAYWTVRDVEQEAGKIPANPLEVAPRNTFTDAGDYYREQTRRRVQESMRRA